MLRSIPPILSLLACAACMQAGPAPGAVAIKSRPHEALAFVQAACGGCHAIERDGLSPDPQAPRWVDIANQQGMSEATLSSWLPDAHNYPEIMDFDLDSDQVEMIVSYMFTLRSENYVRQPD